MHFVNPPLPPVHAAIFEPEAWVQVSSPNTPLLVRHPNGVELYLVRSSPTWSIAVREPHSSVAPDRLAPVVRIPRVHRIPGMQGAVNNTLLVAGPVLRARLDSVLLDITCWAMSLPEPYPCLDRMNACVCAEAYTMTPHPMPLPPDLAARLKALGHVLVSSPTYACLDTTSFILLHIPATAHGKMVLRTQRLLDHAEGHHAA